LKTSDLRSLTVQELSELLSENKRRLFNLRMQLATNQLDNTSKIRETKRDIARIKTILVERELNIG